MPSSHPVSMDSNPQHSLEQIKEKFSEWRNAESRSHKIPEELWSAAVSLIPYFSINRISRELSLGFTELKSRASNSVSKTDKFVELELPAPSPQNVTPIAEIVTNQGTVLRIFSQNCSEIIKAFLKL
ncbi:MAG: hypothetical protein HQM08_06560 [Candidatus Riflebacteria bacterium]|nr:hypothetical protein [Candidatus Riflebacteria bacterium]